MTEKRNKLHRLYDEFAAYYTSERCIWAPSNPRRLYKFAFHAVYPCYRRWFSRPEFMALIFDTLGMKKGKPVGLFQKFAPSKYRGRLPLQEHFFNLFCKRFVGKVRDALRGAHGGVTAPHRLRERPVRFSRSEQEVFAALPEALERLDPTERVVVHMTYWDMRTKTEVAVALGMDRKTVGVRHAAALDKLRRYYEVNVNLAA